jgi:hypothetical protein
MHLYNPYTKSSHVRPNDAVCTVARPRGTVAQPIRVASCIQLCSQALHPCQATADSCQTLVLLSRTM